MPDVASPSAPLLSTKLALPPVRSRLVPRPQLLARLEAGLERKCTLVSAPAGSGKTTLVSTWLAFQQGRVAWLSLDEGDNDPGRFTSYLVAALHTILPNLAPITSFSLPQALTALVNGAAALDRRDDQPFVLVLDDYHAIVNSAIHDGLAFLLDNMPPRLQLVLITRSDPPLPLSRLRARHQLLEIRTADLRFTPAETAVFLNQVMDMDLSIAEIHALEERTEGWAVGLQMAALALQSSGPGTPALARTGAGSNRYVLDYLLEEVLTKQPDQVQTFLARTAILDRLTGSLCDAVCGEPGPTGPGQEMLEWLERANLFVVALDGQREWFRYHHLFVDLLRRRLANREPSLVPELHRRASRWYEASGLVVEAIDHALAGQDLERAALLIEGAAEATMMRSELATVTAWLKALPPDVVRRRPLLCLYYAGVHLLNGEPPAVVQAYLEVAASHGLADVASHGAMALRALLALWQGDIGQSTKLGQQALASLPEQHLLWRGIISGNLGIAYMYNGRDLDLASRMLEEAATMGERAGSAMGAIVALCNLAELRIVQGQLQAARALYDRALALAVEDSGRHLPIRAMAVIGTAELLREWNQLDEAERLLTSAVDLAHGISSLWTLDGYLALARVRQAQGDAKAAQEALERARSVAAGTGATELDDRVVFTEQARLWIAQGRLDAAQGWAMSRGLAGVAAAGAADADPGTLPYALRELEHLVLAELWLALGQAQRAINALSALLAESRALRRTDGELRALVLLAVAHNQQKHRDEALSAVSQALALGRPGRYVRTFIDSGPPMVHLLRQALAEGIAPDYVQRLLSAAGPGPDVPGRRQGLIEPLSERELQVLRLLAASLSTAEIGQQLYVSVNTVRYHLKNIYGKLDAHTRHEALQRAQELELL